MQRVLLMSVALAMCCILITGPVAIYGTSSGGLANVRPDESRSSFKPTKPIIFLGDQNAAATKPGIEHRILIDSRRSNAFHDSTPADDLEAVGLSTREQLDSPFSTRKAYSNHSPSAPPIILDDINDIEPNNDCDDAQPVNIGDRVVCGHISQNDSVGWDEIDMYAFTLDSSYAQWALSCSTYAPSGCEPVLNNIYLSLTDSACTRTLDDSGIFGNRAKLNSILLPGAYKIGVLLGGWDFSAYGYYNLQFAASQYLPSGTPVSEIEPNDNCWSANPLDSGQHVSCGNLNRTQDPIDYFSFTLDNTHDWWNVDLWTTWPPPECSVDIIDTKLSLWNSDCSLLLGYDDNGGQGRYSRLTAYSLSPGDYKILVQTTFRSRTSGYYNLFFEPSAGNPPPANDNCSDVNPVELVADSLYTFAGDNSGATRDCPLLAGDPGGEAWEAITVDQTMNITIDYCGTMFGEVYIILVSGCPCGSLVEADAYDYVCPGTGEITMWFNNVPPGDYYIPIYSFTNSQGPYTIHVKGVPPPHPPPNDNCVDVVPQPLMPNVPLEFTGNSQRSSPDCDSIYVEPGEPFSECWIAFVTEETLNVTLDFCTTTPTLSGWMATTLWDCPCTGFTLPHRLDRFYCYEHGYVNDFNPGLLWLNLPPGTYYYPILINPGEEGQAYVIHVNAKLPPVADFHVTAPGTWQGNTFGAGDDCWFRPYEDQVWEITIPNDGIWTFSLCNTVPPTNLALLLGTSVCGYDIADSIAGCPGGGLPRITKPLMGGIYYLGVEGQDTSGYQLDVYRELTAHFAVNPIEVQGQSIPGAADTSIIIVSNLGDGTLSLDITVMTDNLLRAPVTPRADYPGQRIIDGVSQKPKPISNTPAPPPDGNVVLQGGDDIASATPIPSLPYSDDGTTEGYTDDYNENDNGGGPGSPDVVYSYAPTGDEWVDITLCNGTYWDTKLYVYVNYATPHAPYAINDDGCFEGLASKIVGMWVTVGNTYYIVVDGYNAFAYGPYHIDVTAGGPPPGCYEEGVLFGQSPTPPDNWPIFVGISDRDLLPWGLSYQRYENFAGAFGDITEVKVYGDDQDGDWIPCSQSAHTFDILFLRDNGGMPGDTVAEFYGVEATYTPTGWEYPITMILKEYDIVLPSPVSNLNHGWIMVAGASPGDGCYFNWFCSPYGDHLAYSCVPGIGCLQETGEGYAICLLGTAAEPWLTIDDHIFEHIDVEPYGSAPLSVRMNAADLSEGTHIGNIHFGTNDPFRHRGDVPVTFNVSLGGCSYVPGDVNGSGNFDGIDVGMAVNFFKGAELPPAAVRCLPCSTLGLNMYYPEGDANATCAFNGIDIGYMVNHFKYWAPPDWPYPTLYCLQCAPAGLQVAPGSPESPAVQPVLKGRSPIQRGGTQQ